MVFLLRVRTNSGMQRLVFKDPTATWHDLQLQIKDLCGTPLDHQLLSRQPLHAPEYIESNDSNTLANLQLKNGDILYLAGEANKSSRPANGPGSNISSYSSPLSSVKPATAVHIPAHKLTPNCRHGPKGACVHCMGLQPGEKPKVTGECNHGPGTTCIHCSQHVKSGSASTATWLCNHPESVFCPKCIPPADSSIPSAPSCTCDKSKGQECLSCLSRPPVIKVDKIPFQRWLDEKKALCKYKHPASITCAFCAPPPFPSFAAKLNCDKGHAPYPQAVCLSCAPPNAILRIQEYRHIDSISMESKLLAPFYSSWLRTVPANPSANTNNTNLKQRAAILFGRYMPEPAETNNPGAIRAQVYALYEPPQEYSQAIGVRFLKDSNEKNVHLIASKLGLECVGWVVTTIPREGEKYGGKVFMAGWEVSQAARLQLRYANPNGYSRIVTVILEQSTAVEPVAYQVADMAVALEKENVFSISSSDPYLLSTRIPKPLQMIPTIVYKDRPLNPGQSFLPDELLVKVIVTAPKTSLTLLKYSEMSSGVDAGLEGGKMVIKELLNSRRGEGYETKLSEFNLLVALVKILGEKLIFEVCDAIRDKKELTRETKSQLDRSLLEKGFL